jgi:hypothetical protein
LREVRISHLVVRWQTEAAAAALEQALARYERKENIAMASSEDSPRAPGQLRG